MLLTSLRLVLVSLYLISPSFTVVNTLVSRHEKSFVVHLLEPAIKQFWKGPYVILVSSTNKENFYLLQTFLIPLILQNLQGLFRISANESVDGIYVELGLILVVLIPNFFFF